MFANEDTFDDPQYLNPVPGQWVTYHKRGQKHAEVGQVMKATGERFFGRRVFAVRYEWQTRKGGRRQGTDHVSADRLIAVLPWSEQSAQAGEAA